MHDQSSQSANAVSPLGGRVRDSKRGRRWAGFSAYVRVCPECGWENAEDDRFCVSCAAVVAEVAPQPSSATAPGVEALSRRMTRERRLAGRQRVTDVRGGEGLFASGLVVILATLAVNPDPIIAIPVWLGSVLLILTGIWQLRANPGSLRFTGSVLAVAASLLLGFIGVRAFQATQEPVPELPAVVVLATPTATASAASTPVADIIAGEIPMIGGGITHDGVMPGPAPAAAPNLAWQFDTGSEIHGAATLSQGLLYLMSKSGDLMAVDARTGNQVWSTPVTGYVTRVSPALSEGMVFAGGGFGFGAWDAATGDQRWSVALPYVGQASPTVHDGLVIVSSQERWSYGLDSATGEVRWRIPTEGIVFGSAAIVGDRAIYATDEGIVYAVNLESGRVTWRQQVTGSVFAPLVVSSGVVLASTQAGELTALDVETGAHRWTTLHGGATSPATDGDIIVVASASGGIYGLDLATGDQRWLYPTGTQGTTSPAISDGLALVGAGNSLLAIDLETGTAAWYYLAGDQIDTAPIVAGGHVFFGSRDGFLTAIAVRD